MNTQFKKGVLELCVLALLSKKEHYGYEIVSRVSETIEVSEGTIYPLLRRLRNEGYVTTHLVESTQGPSRKYYTLTLQGQAYTETMINEWLSFTGHVNEILEGDIV